MRMVDAGKPGGFVARGQLWAVWQASCLGRPTHLARACGLQDARLPPPQPARLPHVPASDVDFQPVKTWLGRQATEKVEGWDCEVS